MFKDNLLCTHKPDNLGEVDQFLEKHKIPQYEILNSCIITKEIEFSM